MSKRLVTGAAALALLVGACGLGDKQAQADDVIDAGESLLKAESVSAVLRLRIVNVKPDREVVLQAPPRIAPGESVDLATVMIPSSGAASIEGVVRFVDDVMYERIAPTVVTRGNLPGAASNLGAIVGAATGDSVTPATLAPETTTTTTGRGLRRTVRIAREWVAFDFAAIEDNDDTRHAGSLAINPVALMRLTTGVLTGSIERVSAHEFKANVSRDKAERELEEDAREVLDKMFVANAVTRSVFPARFTLDGSGRLVKFSVTLRQELSGSDRADATYVFVFGKPAGRATIVKPAKPGTVTVDTLGQLVTTVSGA